MTPTERRSLDPVGFWLMLGLAMLFGANNLMIKLGNEGLQPAFFAGLRSIVAIPVLGAWMLWRGFSFRWDLWREGILAALLFSAEFLLLFIALDNTSVVRASSLFYAMPIWLALAAHFLFPGERLTPLRLLGFALGFGGVVLSIAGRGAGSGVPGNLWGDLAAVVAGMSWAAIVVVSRRTRFGTASAEAQIFWQVIGSALLLTATAPLFGGPLVRDFTTLHGVMLVVQSVGVVTAGFVTWFWLIGRYKASTVASFSFLTPLLSALLGWLVLGETVGPVTPIALALLIAGLFLINRR
ncbi:DMT family transporter [Pararhodobacter sp. CCB-MM2]|uniref:DMT family transporter n=1 Tax=Pararhodobacter sp. CCB-MM2 TaxID=1786003 RepID=UPI00082E4DC7|nr:DMT family transporter [Pararhodobacter sp. CCB-MM2]MCA2010205.1 DMT family transporter [Cereibacter sphaeroides]